MNLHSLFTIMVEVDMFKEKELALFGYGIIIATLSIITGKV